MEGAKASGWWRMMVIMFEVMGRKCEPLDEVRASTPTMKKTKKRLEEGYKGSYKLLCHLNC